MNTSDKSQTTTVIAELKLIFSRIILCLLSIQSDIKIGTHYLNCTNTKRVIPLSGTIEYKIGNLKDYVASIQSLCKTLNKTCIDKTSASQQE